MAPRSVVTTGSAMAMMTIGSPMEGAASPTSKTEGSLAVERDPSMGGLVGWEQRGRSVVGKRTRRGRSIVWRWVCRTSRNVLAVTLMRGSVLDKQTNDVPNGHSNLPRRMNICVSRAGRRSIDVCPSVGRRTASSLRSTVGPIMMRSPVGTVSDVARDAPQPGDELRVPSTVVIMPRNAAISPVRVWVDRAVGGLSSARGGSGISWVKEASEGRNSWILIGVLEQRRIL